MDDKIKKYLRGESSEQELSELLTWLRQPGHNNRYRKTKKHWLGNDYDHLSDSHTRELMTFQAKMLSTGFKQSFKLKKTKQFLSYAALFLLLLSVGSMWLYFRTTGFYTSRICSTVVVDGGQMSKLVLPDSSLVWINSLSKLSYDNLFGKKNRQLQLEGQAFFQVSKNKTLPFIVSSRDMEVTATGTMFDVECYPEAEETTIILHEGGVNISPAHSPQKTIQLKAGEMLHYNNQNKKIQIRCVNTAKLLSWKEGKLNIYDQSLNEAAEKLSRRYNCTFVVDETMAHQKVTLSLNDQDLNSVVRILKTIIPVNIYSTNDSIYIDSKK